MAIQKPNYSRWKWYPMTDAQKCDGAALNSAFQAALSAMEFPPETVSNISLEFKRASVTFTPAERKAGVYHRYRDGLPFMRVKIAVKEETKETASIVHALINNLRVDKWIRDKPFAIEFDTRESLSGETFDKIHAAVLPASPLARRQTPAPKPPQP